MPEEMDTAITLGGNRYHIDINAYTIDQVRRQVGVDVLKVFEDQTVLETLSDGSNFIDALFIFTQDDRERHKTTDPVAFAKLFNSGDAIEAASEAFKNSLIAFFPSHQRAPLQKLMELERAAAEKIQGRAMELLENGKVDELIQLQLSELDSRFSSAVESLESTIREGVHSGN